jgi:hypothetical protein
MYFYNKDKKNYQQLKLHLDGRNIVKSQIYTV